MQGTRPDRILAKEDGVSLNQWIATAVAQKIGVVETAATFFQRRAGTATADDLARHGEGAERAIRSRGRDPTRLG